MQNIVSRTTPLSFGERLEVRLFLCLFLFMSVLVNAQNPTFYAQVSKNKVAVAEVFQVAFTLNGSGSNLVYPTFKDFDIYSGPNQSQSMSMVNGNFSQSTTISFFIAAKKEGKFIIGSASVVSGNQKLETTPITIEVSKNNTSSPQQANGNQGNPNTSTEKNQYASAVSHDDLFVRTFLSKTKCYMGEQLTLTQKVYSRVDLRGFQNVKFPPYNGFWSQQEDANKQVNLQQENVDGVTYYVAEYHKVYLFPQRSGHITIEPIELDCIVRRQTKHQPRNIFEQFFGAGGYEDAVVKVKSKPVKVEVVELPTNDKPQSFSGAVGDFSYKAQLSKESVKANDAVNLKITISGKGNIKLLEPLTLTLPESFETYDPKISESIQTNGGISGSKTYDYLIIPREKGEFVINNLNFSYFDASKRKYMTIPSPDIRLTVLPGDHNTPQVISPSKQDIKERENDIRYIKTGDLELQPSGTEFFSSYKHYLLLITPSLLFLGAFLFVKQRIKVNSNALAVRQRKAAKLAKKQLAAAEKCLNTGNKEVFFTETLNALHQYISNKFALPVADLSKENIADTLRYKQVDEHTTNRLLNTLHTCEYAKYAPSAVTEDLQAVYNDTVELISSIEEQIKK